MDPTKNKNTFPYPDDDENEDIVNKAVKEIKENPIKTVGTIITLIVGGGLFS